MRHRKSGVKLNRTTSHRQAMFRNMVTSLFKHDRIKTTDAKAKELRRWADHIVTLAKRGDLHARRMAMSIVREKDVVHKIFEEAAERFGSINGGYTRMIKIGRRPGDTAAMTLVELVSSDDSKPTKKKQTPAKKEAKPAPQSEAAPASPSATEESAEAAPAQGESAVSAEEAVSDADVDAAAPENPADEASAEEEADKNSKSSTDSGATTT